MIPAIGLNNAPPAPAAPPHRRKTHVNDALTALLRDLPNSKKRERNQNITARNEQRAVGRAYRLQNPDLLDEGQLYSSDESLITISDGEPEPPSASQQARDFLASMSPKAATSWIQKLLPKRARSLTEPEDDPSLEGSMIQKAKRFHTTRRAEEKVEPGKIVPPGLNNALYALYLNEVYIPLSLFTNEGLRTLNREGNTLPTKKITYISSSGKQARVLDTAEFEKRHGNEKDLSRPEWTEASGNLIRFTESLGDEAYTTRWYEHFNFLESREDSIRNFEAIKRVDIKFRKDYLAHPFSFNYIFYSTKVDKAIADFCFENYDKLEARMDRYDKGPPSAQSSRFPCLKAFIGQPSGSPSGTSSRPFPSRTVGDPSAAVCIICAKKGHVFSTCSSATFDDNKSLTCKVDKGNLITIKGKSSVCRNWNLRGPNSSTCNSHGQERVHVCSFCGEASHHAFSWTCRRDPSKSTPQN